jgi:hypothetical protein
MSGRESPPDLPLPVRVGIIIFLTLLLGASVAADVLVPTYASAGGQFITLALIGLVGASIGVAKTFTGGGDKK